MRVAPFELKSQAGTYYYRDGAPLVMACTHWHWQLESSSAVDHDLFFPREAILTMELPTRHSNVPLRAAGSHHWIMTRIQVPEALAAS
jgi:hypothetical protein